ncbi:MAG: flagellar protein FlaG [Magnetococcales bacterium]|nr:flagellar protein FlaG [Magnetococcales bacterium]MBF0150836.1 flagellar protein FlaG [Magnetococcales bacterium]MBF0630792.1 flagellar protein FlaG [Magnetococcales bacterium]
MERINDVAIRTEREKVGSVMKPLAGKLHPGIDRGGGFDAELVRAESKVESKLAVVGKDELKGLADEITQALSGFKSLHLSMDRELNQVVVRVMDARSNHVIRQIPGERMVDLVKQMRDLEGVLLKATA